MKKEIKELFPTWIDETHLEYDLMLGNDVDSLLSCNLLEEITDGKWKINYFYDFKNFYRYEKTGLKPIGVDMAFTKKARCFDNHLTKISHDDSYNKLCANPNLPFNISRDNYSKKYGMSTLLLIMSLYDIPLPQDPHAREILLAVDTAFKGHFVSAFNKTHTDWLERLGYTELIDTLKSRDMDYYYKVLTYYGLQNEITIKKSGELFSMINYEVLQEKFDWKIYLPEQDFKLIKKCKRKGSKLEQGLPPKDKLISLAFTGENYASYTYVDWGLRANVALLF